MGWMVQALKEGIWAIVMVAGPVVLIAAIIGLGIGIIQTVTNIQEQTTPAALKMISVFILFFVAGIWMFNYLGDFTRKIMNKAFVFVPQNRQRIKINENFNQNTVTTAISKSLGNNNIQELRTLNAIDQVNKQNQYLGNTLEKSLNNLPPAPKDNINNTLLQAYLMNNSNYMPTNYNNLSTSMPESPAIVSPPRTLERIKPILPSSAPDIPATVSGDALSPPPSQWY